MRESRAGWERKRGICLRDEKSGKNGDHGHQEVAGNGESEDDRMPTNSISNPPSAPHLLLCPREHWSYSSCWYCCCSCGDCRRSFAETVRCFCLLQWHGRSTACALDPQANIPQQQTFHAVAGMPALMLAQTDDSLLLLLVGHPVEV